MQIAVSIKLLLTACVFTCVCVSLLQKKQVLIFTAHQPQAPQPSTAWWSRVRLLLVWEWRPRMKPCLSRKSWTFTVLPPVRQELRQAVLPQAQKAWETSEKSRWNRNPYKRRKAQVWWISGRKSRRPGVEGSPSRDCCRKVVHAWVDFHQWPLGSQHHMLCFYSKLVFLILNAGMFWFWSFAMVVY